MAALCSGDACGWVGKLNDSEDSVYLLLCIHIQENTHEDVLRMFPSALTPIKNLISMVPVIKPRKYSIASSSQLHWDCILPSGRKRLGLCTKYLFDLDACERPKIAAQVHDGILAPPAGTIKCWCASFQSSHSHFCSHQTARRRFSSLAWERVLLRSALSCKNVRHWIVLAKSLANAICGLEFDTARTTICFQVVLLC